MHTGFALRRREMRGDGAEAAASNTGRAGFEEPQCVSLLRPQLHNGANPPPPRVPRPAQPPRSPAASRAVSSRISDFCSAFFPRICSFNTILYDPQTDHLVHRVYNSANKVVKAPASAGASDFPIAPCGDTGVLVPGPRLGSPANAKPRVSQVLPGPHPKQQQISQWKTLYRELLKPPLLQCSRTSVCFGVSISASTTTRQQELQSERINV